MKTDVVALDPIIRKAVHDLRQRGQSAPTTDQVLAATEPHSGHEVILRVDRELDPREVESIADAALAEWSLLEAEREAEPHAVHFDDAPPDQDGTLRAKADSCPDCTRGLVSRGGDLICVRLTQRTKVTGCHLGCIVACGMPR